MAIRVVKENLDCIPLTTTFQLISGQPLTLNDIFYSYEEASAYAATDAAYIGQTLTVIQNSVISYYAVQHDSTLKQLDAKDIFLEQLKNSVNDIIKSQVLEDSSSKFAISFTKRENNGKVTFEPYLTKITSGEVIQNA